jgi:cyclopropane-fatty-acyl-phospholipid synthase
MGLNMLFEHLLGKCIKSGDLTLIGADGKRTVFGDGQPPRAAIRLHDKALHRRLAINPRLAVGEAYMDGTLTVEDGDLRALLNIFGQNMKHFQQLPLASFLMGLEASLRYFQQRNPVGIARKNVSHHYDLSDDLYDLFLDDDRQYSCAYFQDPRDSLETAQENKKRHIAAKLMLDRDDLKVLDIGSGWGGLGMFLAQQAGAQVTGVTLSTEQHRVSQERAAARGLDDRAAFHLRDYRHEQGPYDRIVSVGMFEHVGTGHYGEYFSKISNLLADDGVALIHTIGRNAPPGASNPWLRKYIFPGGYTPALSEIVTEVEKTGLWITDVEILRLHYADTLRHWDDRFQANRERAAAIYDERFCRMWEFYLIGCEISFRHLGQVVYQIQLSKKLDTVPVTRDYIGDWENGKSLLSEAAD